MSYWQFAEAVDGWIAANSDSKDEGLSPDEEDGLWNLVSQGS